ncbi:TIGR00730 family Rossman fold protein [Candidatus Dependentiae bacterium]|nr:TIGR00730 family Rossman fold protein [Candidatus Dependentiae bacterium]
MLNRIKEYSKFLKSLTQINFRLIKGMWKLTKLPQPAITIFGGSRITEDSIHAERAFKLSNTLTCEGFSIITGGGPGIMSAANKGAYEYAKKQGANKNKNNNTITSLGISLTSFAKEKLNPYTHDSIIMDHFFSRKWLLVRYSVGFIVFPGGFGTLDELFEIITLEQCYQMPKIPIVLMSKGYWSPMLDWFKSRLLSNGLIEKKDLDLFFVTSDVDEACEIICKHCKGKNKLKKPLYTR